MVRHCMQSMMRPAQRANVVLKYLHPVVYTWIVSSAGFFDLSPQGCGILLCLYRKRVGIVDHFYGCDFCRCMFMTAKMLASVSVFIIARSSPSHVHNVLRPVTQPS